MPRQNFIGFVVSQGKMQKTIKVRVMQRVFNKKIQKELLKKRDYLVHDESEICREGDMVRIEATRPLSARKFFAVAQMIRNKGQQFAQYEQDAKTQVAAEEASMTKEFLEKRAHHDKLLDNDFANDLDLVYKLSSKKGTGELSSEEQQQVAELKAKYGVNSEDEAKAQLFLSEIENIAKKHSEALQNANLAMALEDVLKDEDKLKQVEAQLGLEGKKKNIAKNLIRKFIKEADPAELESLGIHYPGASA